MKTGYKQLMLVLASFSLAACQYIPTVTLKDLNASYVKKTEAEAKIAQLERDHQTALTTNSEKLVGSQTKVIGGMDNQIQAGADALYTIQQVASLPSQPGTLELTRARAIEGFTAMGKPPTIKEITEGGERLKKYLTTYQTNDPVEIEKLRVDHARLVKENGILVETTKIAKEEVISVKQEKLTIEQRYITDTSAAQTQLNQANNNVISKEHQRAEQERVAKEKAESFERLKRELMIWCGIVAILALAGAVYSPVGKGGLATISGVLGAVTIALPFIQPFMIWILLGIVMLAIIGAVGVFLYKHNQAEVVNTNLVNAIEDTKEKAGATVADLKKNLTDWNTKYVKDKAGNIVEVVDEKVEAYIKDKLAQVGRLKTKK